MIPRIFFFLIALQVMLMFKCEKHWLALLKVWCPHLSPEDLVNVGILIGYAVRPKDLHFLQASRATWWVDFTTLSTEATSLLSAILCSFFLGSQGCWWTVQLCWERPQAPVVDDAWQRILLWTKRTLSLICETKIVVRCVLDFYVLSIEQSRGQLHASCSLLQGEFTLLWGTHELQNGCL